MEAVDERQTSPISAAARSSTARGGLLQLVPNLDREPVAFDAPLRSPLRFREAISPCTTW